MTTWRVIVEVHSVPADYDLEVEADDEDGARDRALEEAEDLLSEATWDLFVASAQRVAK